MTSPSLRKRPTTRPSIRGRSERRASLLTLALGLGLAATASLGADWKGFVASTEEALAMPDPPRVVLSGASGVEQAGGPVDDEGVCLGCVALAGQEDPASDPCAEDRADCRDKLADLREDTIASIDLDIRVSGRAGNDYPCECRLEGETFRPRRFATTTFTWTAAGYCHKPLYFEHWNLERYGHSHGFVADSFLSAAHFFTTLPALPYKMGVELPWECVYPLGYYRPGSCAPWMVPAVPFSWRGVAVEAATVTGIVFLLP